MQASAIEPMPLSGLDFQLLNNWQHEFPLDREPFVLLAQRLLTEQSVVLEAFDRLQRNGAISRIGGVFAPGAGGAALLAAMAVPVCRLARVAEIVSAHPGVNHNYEREHGFNLWFVMTGRDTAAVEAAMLDLERATGLTALRLRMQRAYRIDLGFDLCHGTAALPMRKHCATRTGPIAAIDRSLAEHVEAGLPITAQPFDAWARAIDRPVAAVLATLSDWVGSGTLKRFGVVVRHHELGYSANAMTVFDVPDDQVDACGDALAHQAGVTLAYRRERAPQWRYNLYAMVHGTDRTVVQGVIERVALAAGLADYPRAVLFSTRRFKQTGARRFRDMASTHAPENRDAVAR